MLSEFKKIMICVLALVMVLSAVGCSSTKTITTTSDVWTTVEEEDDTDNTDDTGSAETPSGGSTSTPSGGGSTSSSGGYTDNVTGDFDPYKGVEKYRGKTVKVLFWFTPDANEQKVIDSFTKKTGIKVKLYYAENAKYGSKLSSMVASGNSPDVAAVFDSYFPSLVNKGLFEEIEKGQFDLKNDPAYDLASMQYTSWKGKYYGVVIKNAWSTDHPLVFFNRTLFKNAGVADPSTLWKQGKWNWDTMKETAQKMTKNINGVDIYGLGWAPSAYFLASYGTDVIKVDNDNGTITNNLKDPKVVKTFEYIANMYSSGIVAPKGSSWTTFTNGQCAMWPYGQSWIEDNGFFDDLKDEWSAVPFPSPKGEKEIHPVNVGFYGLGKGCKNPEMGSYFIRWHQDPANWDIKGRCNTPELYELYKTMNTYSSYDAIQGRNMFISVCTNLDEACYGNVNDVGTILAKYSGNLDSAISNIVKNLG